MTALDPNMNDPTAATPLRRVTMTTTRSYIYDPERVKALHEQLQPDPDLYGDDPVYALFAYLGDGQFQADVFEDQGDFGEWAEKDEAYDPEA